MITVSILIAPRDGESVISSVLEQEGVQVEVILASDPNEGLVRATGTYVKFLESGDKLAEGSLFAQASFLERTGADVAAGPWEELERVRPSSPALFTWDPMTSLLREGAVPMLPFLMRTTRVKSQPWDSRMGSASGLDFLVGLATRRRKFAYDSDVFVGTHEPTLGSAARDRVAVALKAHAKLAASGYLSPERSRALAHLLWESARLYYRRDRRAYDECVKRMEAICPGYRPEGTTVPWFRLNS